MVTDINRGIGMQLFANSISPENNASSFATTYKSFDFNEHNDLVLTGHYHNYIPQYLVLNMFNWINQYNDNLYSMYNLIHNLNLTFNVGYRVILQFPIKFLWGLKTPIIEDSKLYIHIPFDMFFGKIQMGLLANNDVHFSINEPVELHNYVRNYSMISQIFINNPYTSNFSQSLQNNMVHPIQQLSTIHIISGSTNNMVSEFRIKTDVFQGRTRGLFISCNVSALVQLRFYINNVLRDDYDSFFINHICKKINNELLYFPFNGSNEYGTRNFGSADGALDFSCLDSSILHLQFSQPQQRVSVYNLYFNEFRMHYGLGGLVKNMPPRIANINNSVDAIIPVVPNIDMMDLSGNIIVVNATNTGTVNTGTGTVGGQTGPGFIEPIYQVRTESVINMEVGERNICNITHEQINVGQRYMSCNNCHNNYSETAITTWLQKKPVWSRTCPTCRTIWDNYHVYVNNPVD
jgi:hypothetical protein